MASLPGMPLSPPATATAAYADRLESSQGKWWKRLLDVQRPYRWHLRALDLGFVLDVGCGLGRNLAHLHGRGIGIDHNPQAVSRCRLRGLRAYLPEDFEASGYARAGRFDSLLLAHVAEHMHLEQARALLRRYLPFVKAGGRVLLIVPQERGQTTDATHVEFLNMAALYRLATTVGLQVERTYSFPFPRPAGLCFAHNESVVIARKPG